MIAERSISERPSFTKGGRLVHRALSRQAACGALSPAAQRAVRRVRQARRTRWAGRQQCVFLLTPRVETGDVHVERHIVLQARLPACVFLVVAVFRMCRGSCKKHCI